MKKGFFVLLCVALLFSASPGTVSANSGPTFFKGGPASELLSVDKESKIQVLSENLEFDLRRMKFNGSGGRITASYEMRNPTEKTTVVQMAFPLISSLAFDSNSVSVKSDGNSLDFDIYFGDSLEGGTYSAEKPGEADLDFEALVAQIDAQPYRPQNYDLKEAGTRYIFTVIPEKEKVRFSIAFEIPEGVKVMGDAEFHSMAFDSEKNQVTLEADCEGESTFSLFVVGGALDYIMEARIDNQKTEAYTCKVSTEESVFSQYIDTRIETYYREFGENYKEEILPPTDLEKDVYYEGLDRYFEESDYVEEGALFDLARVSRPVLIVYGTEFPPDGVKTISVSYEASATGDRQSTKDWKYSYLYLFHPAQYWAEFGTLDITIRTPDTASYLVKSSVDFSAQGNNTYVAHLAALPQEDLTFTVYPEPEVAYGWGASGYLGIFALLALGALLCLGGIILSIRRRKGKRE